MISSELNSEVTRSIPTLKDQAIDRHIRAIGINRNYWYPVAWSDELAAGMILPVMIWKQSIALYRNAQSQVTALSDRCPHMGVELHQGEVQGDRLVCPYHGWEFDSTGTCVNIPYFPEGQKLPRACTKSFPTQEKYGLIWVFPGDLSRMDQHPIPDIPEFDDPTLIQIPITAEFKVHYSLCQENTIDVFHGHLHQNLQGWFDTRLLKLQETENSVSADYAVSYRGILPRLLGLSKGRSSISTRTVSIRFRYPHYCNQMEGVSALYGMRLPVSPEVTRSYSLLFLKLPFPQWLIQPLKFALIPLLRRFLFLRFLAQDIEMMESIQRNDRIDPASRSVEVNPAVIALHRVLLRQAETEP